MAHEGPAYPIIVDHPFFTNKLTAKLSVWADPDTYKGTFFFYLDNSKLSSALYQVEASPQNAPTHVLKVESSENILIVPFDQNLMWNVTIKLLDPKNREILTSKKVVLEVTPPGPNKTEFVIYLIPFVIVAAFWIKMTVVKRNNKHK